MSKCVHYECFFFVLVFFGAFLCFPGNVNAGSVGWGELSGKEKSVLSDFKQHWSSYSTYKQKKLRRWAQKPLSARNLIKQRFRQWSALSTSSKARIKLELQRYKRMPHSKRMKLKAWWRWVKKLPGPVRRKLEQKLPGMTKAQKRNYIRELERKYGRR